MNMNTRLRILSQMCAGQYWAERILQELQYLHNLLTANGQGEEKLVRILDVLEQKQQENGAITRADALEAEAELACYQEQARSLRLICAAHAHIDMNWQWGTDETVGIVIDTFQTMLNLLREYPDYVFTQSQASTYEIIDKYAPSMLPEIRQRVQEGRWEVAATTWVEPDKNMTSTESQVRHILYTKQYLSKLLGLDPDSLQLDFEPDTFGHNRCIPEVLSRGGVKYYYHCRGNDSEELYRWRAPSGSEILVHREPNWYLGPITYDMAAYLPEFCARNHITCGLKVYGVGDHGGGPTRRDIERILDMRTWPLMPQISFGRIDEYFHAIESSLAHFPVVERELNFVFTGCYTTQSRIKQANRFGEDRLYDSEALSAMAKLAGCEYTPVSFAPAWKNVLFNHFHDILPGSGVRETRDAALGLAQETNSYCVGNANRALYAMGRQIDTAAFGTAVDPDSTAEGAGVGYGTSKGSDQERAFADTTFQVTQTSRSGGKIRAYTIFNPTQYDRRETVELTVWDWTLPLHETSIFDAEKQEHPFAVLHENKDYWRHVFCKLAFVAEVPAFGYATYYIAPAVQLRPAPKFSEPRVHRMSDAPIVLENKKLRAEFARSTMALTSLLDKQTGREMLRAPASFRLIDEVDSGGYSAWIIGTYGNVTDLNQSCFVESEPCTVDPIRQEVRYQLKFRDSSLRVKIRLDEDSSLLRLSTEVDWHEIGRPQARIPMLQFYIPYAYHAEAVRYDIAGGYIDRPQLGHDVPALLYAAPICKDGSSVMLTTDCKYGYRCYEDALSVTLLRSSHTPDHYPESGVNQMELGLGIAPNTDWYALTQQAFCFSHPLYVYSNDLHTGTMPANGQLLHLQGRARVTALKLSENGEALVLRAYQNDDAAQTLSLTPAVQYVQTDLCENVITQPCDSQNMSLAPWQLHSIQWKSEQNDGKRL